MKNDLHLAFKTTQNFPLQISLYDSVKYHLLDQVRLISQLPGEWPKVRGRELANAKSYIVEATYELAGHTVQHIHITAGEQDVWGRLVDGKYFLSDAVLNQVVDLEMFLIPFAESGLKPMARREWSWDYMGSMPGWYTQVTQDTEQYTGVEEYYPIVGFEKHGITNMLDLLAYSYKFVWNPVAKQFEAIFDEHEITKRIRKPWMQYLVQSKFGEAPATEADLNKLVAFLLTKVELTDEEKVAVSAFHARTVTLDDLTRVNGRQAILNQILDAYNDPFVLKTGVDIKDDPLFKLTFE